jgi:cytochrome d ubiquinol oxidase subunit II
MFESLSYLTLQQYWWVIISLLGSVLVFLLFVQGGQTLVYTLGKNEDERTVIVNALGRKWEFTFTTLVTLGGSLFASFPLFYSVSFGGAYWLWITILFCFVIQAVAYEFRSKPGNLLGHKTYEVFLLLNGILGTILLGATVGSFFNGSPFSVNFSNIVNAGNPVITRWETPYHGLETIFNLHNLSLGIAVFFLARTIALLYFIRSIEKEDIIKRARRQLVINALPFLIFFITFITVLLIKKGFAYNPETKIIILEKYKYMHNLIDMPAVGILFVLGTLLVIFGIGKSLFSGYAGGIWFTGAGTIMAVFCLFIIAGFNNTALYPSTYNLQNSLTIENSSSSKYTLIVMSYVSLLIPVVFTYIYYTWKAISSKKIDVGELKKETHIY